MRKTDILDDILALSKYTKGYNLNAICITALPSNYRRFYVTHKNSGKYFATVIIMKPGFDSRYAYAFACKEDLITYLLDDIDEYLEQYDRIQFLDANQLKGVGIKLVKSKDEDELKVVYEEPNDDQMESLEKLCTDLLKAKTKEEGQGAINAIQDLWDRLS